MNLKERFNILYLDGQARSNHNFMQGRRPGILGLRFFLPCDEIAIDSNYNKAGIIISKVTSKVLQKRSWRHSRKQNNSGFYLQFLPC